MQNSKILNEVILDIFNHQISIFIFSVWSQKYEQMIKDFYFIYDL
jgi:hypothetical protein